jgi:Leucine-rich repeat (LRR) protein
MKNFYILFFLCFSVNTFSQNLYSDSAYKRIAPYIKISDALADSGVVTKLVLKKNKLVSIPEEIFKMTELEYLDLSKNKIDSIPKEIGELKNLRVLIISKNKVKKIPIELYGLKNLKILDLSSNDIKITKGYKKLT